MQKLIKIDLSLLFIGILCAHFIPSFPLYSASEFEIHYSKGVKAHDEGNLVEAETELSEAVKLNPQSLEANYAIGIVQQEKNNHAQALKNLNVIYKTDKTYKNLLYRVALSYFYMNKDDRAEKFFKLELKNGKDVNIKDECHFYLGKIYERTNRQELAKEEMQKISLEIPEKGLKVEGKRWFFNAQPGLQFDTNVALISDGVAVPAYLSGKSSPRLSVSLNGGMTPLLRKDVMLTLSYLYYHGFNFMNNLHEYNINQHTFSFDTVFDNPSGNITYRFLLGYDYQLSLIVPNDSNDYEFFSQSHAIKPRFQVLWSKSITTEFKTHIIYDDFYASAFPEDNRDAFNFMGGFENSWKFNNSMSKIYVGFDYVRNMANGFNFNYYGLIPSVGFETPLWIITRLNLDFSYAYTRFVNYQPSPPLREDNTYTVGLNLNKKLSNMVEANLNETLVINKSIQDYSYKRDIISLIFSFLF